MPTHLLVSRTVGLVRRIARRVGLRSPPAQASPGNWQAPAVTPDSINYQVEYAVSGGEYCRSRLHDLGIPILGARVLEIGPGIAFGTMAYLRAAGAQVTVTDRWLAPWSDVFHGPVYSAVADSLEGKDGFDVSPLRRMVAAKSYADGTINCLTHAAEDLSSIADETFDAVVSNAVLEHIEQPHIAFRELHRVTRSGGAGLHQVDFRDHRDFSRPLEHLLLDAGQFESISRPVHFEFGSQLRQPDYATLLTVAGFLIERYQSNDQAKETYLDDVLERLKARGGEVSSLPTRAILADLGGLFWLRKP